MSEEPRFAKLEELLRRRVNVIADHVWRDADPAAHLDALREVSVALDREREILSPELPPRLSHFLGNASYAKALAWLEGDTESH